MGATRVDAGTARALSADLREMAAAVQEDRPLRTWDVAGPSPGGVLDDAVVQIRRLRRTLPL